MVLLLHELADGSSHYDWMVEVPGGTVAVGGAGLMTFRVAVRIDGDGVKGFSAERLGDHRAVYLDYEGPISGGRGRVARVAAGEVEGVRECGCGRVEVCGRWSGEGGAWGERGAWVGVPVGRKWWVQKMDLADRGGD
jgi:hypothetical protein